MGRTLRPVTSDVPEPPKATDRSSFIEYLTTARTMNCPFCGQNKWHLLGGLDRVMTSYGESGPPESAGEDQSPLELVPVVALNCQSCGFLRLHAHPFPD